MALSRRKSIKIYKKIYVLHLSSNFIFEGNYLKIIFFFVEKKGIQWQNNMYWLYADNRNMEKQEFKRNSHSRNSGSIIVIDYDHWVLLFYFQNKRGKI